MGIYGGFPPKKIPPNTPLPTPPAGGGGYIHEVDHAAAGLGAEAFGPEIFICKKKTPTNPSVNGVNELHSD